MSAKSYSTGSFCRRSVAFGDAAIGSPHDLTAPTASSQEGSHRPDRLLLLAVPQCWEPRQHNNDETDSGAEQRPGSQASHWLACGLPLKH
ncbi:hypothetical protein SKAU_G00030510 [Synaphobranchus kaupii]|uniref:Uncharacterized protein n=1 Tax=Synaphobranchus kaupii TaxID=118154 RepID=A0A9Q1JE20_SYNKA|nr:hypothetical protein SKAU_G00030510 [Synaphobranchus kaupii]